MIKRLALTMIFAALLLAATTELAHADSEFLDKIEETRGFSNRANGVKCNEYYTTGTAVIGDRKCDYAWFNADGDSIVRYPGFYKMPRNGWLKFRVHRNGVNAGWAWTFKATIRKRDGTNIIREVSTGTGNRGRVHLWRGEVLQRIELVGHDGPDATGPGRLFTFHVWTMAINR